MNGRCCVAGLILAVHLAAASFLAAADQPDANRWVRLDGGPAGERSGAMLVATEPGKMLLVGPGKDAAFVQSYDVAAKAWSDFAAAPPGTKDGIHPYYQTAYDPGTNAVYCLSGGTVLYALDVAARTWKVLPPAAELEGLSWQALACDPAGKRLVVVGSDKTAANLGVLRTVVYDIPSAKWTRLDTGDEAAVRGHRELVAAREAVIDLVGRIRLAWYRDPAGLGSDAERAALRERCASIRPMPQMADFAADAEGVSALLAGGKTLDALKAARAWQRRIEDRADERGPAPPSRRNSPLVFDPKNRVFVLFGGDHEDYLTNDVWVLDVEKRTWRRGKPEVSPSPRAGHALVYLPGCGRIAMYEGYVQSGSTDYAAGPIRPADPVQLWLYDVAADRWELVGAWPLPGKNAGADAFAAVGRFYGYSAQYFSPPAPAAGAGDTLILAAGRTSKQPGGTWTLRVEPAKADAAGRARLGIAGAPQRLYRPAPFRAEYCEVAVPAPDTGLDRLPANRWVKLPAPPRNPCQGCRQRDWGTSVWDSDRDQILLWGGGHCVRSASTVAHYSPVSGRTVEGFDADEPYGGNGGGGFDSSLWNRPWVSVHNYKHYAYDPKCRLMVSGRGYLYDPDRMDWLRLEPLPLPYRFEWGSTALAGTPHGAVAWARRKTGEDAGLWLFDRQRGWTDLEPQGRLFPPYCDSHGLVYDSKRDRLIFSGVGGGYSKISNGTLLSFDFKTKRVEVLTPANPDLAKTGCARELAYIGHADWVLVGHNLRVGDAKTGKSYTRVYDCAADRMFLLDAGPVPDGYGAGWMYDARRKLAYSFSTNGEAWAIRLDPTTAVKLDKPLEQR